MIEVHWRVLQTNLQTILPKDPANLQITKPMSISNCCGNNSLAWSCACACKGWAWTTNHILYAPVLEHGTVSSSDINTTQPLRQESTWPHDTAGRTAGRVIKITQTEWVLKYEAYKLYKSCQCRGDRLHSNFHTPALGFTWPCLEGKSLNPGIRQRRKQWGELPASIWIMRAEKEPKPWELSS